MANNDNTASNGYTDQILRVTTQAAESLIALVEVEDVHHLNSDSTVLDSGAGSGALTYVLASKCPGMSIVAADISRPALETLKRRRLPNVTTLLLDATKDHVAQGLPPRSFTHALSTFTLQFLPTPQIAIDEMHRILAPGGIIGVAIWSENGVEEVWNEACGKVDSKDWASEGKWRSVEQLEKALERAGFVDIRSEETGLEMRFETGEEFADYCITSANPAFEVLRSTWKGDNVEEVREELVKVFSEKFEDGRVRMRAACAVGRKALETPPLGEWGIIVEP